jgi:hypothetical protein
MIKIEAFRRASVMLPERVKAPAGAKVGDWRAPVREDGFRIAAARKRLHCGGGLFRFSRKRPAAAPGRQWRAPAPDSPTLRGSGRDRRSPRHRNCTTTAGTS